jgi:hypothetical protein
MGKTKAGSKQKESNISETLGSFTNEAANQMSPFAPDFFSQLMGWGLGKSSESGQHEKAPTGGKATGGEIVNFGGVAKSENKKVSIEKRAEAPIKAGINYHEKIARSGEKSLSRSDQERKQLIQELLVEIHKLVNSTKLLQTEFAQIGVQSAPENVGQYHINFFEWMLSVIRIAREKVEDSGAWLQTVKGKAGKKGYWGMFQKHGTSFGMSNERQVATQTG